MVGEERTIMEEGGREEKEKQGERGRMLDSRSSIAFYDHQTLSPMEQKEYKKSIGNNRVYPIVVDVHVTHVALYKRNNLGLMIIQVKKLVCKVVYW